MTTTQGALPDSSGSGDGVPKLVQRIAKVGGALATAVTATLNIFAPDRLPKFIDPAWRWPLACAIGALTLVIVAAESHQSLRNVPKPIWAATLGRVRFRFQRKHFQNYGRAASALPRTRSFDPAQPFKTHVESLELPQRKRRLLIFSGPAGSGKSTLLGAVVKDAVTRNSAIPIVLKTRDLSISLDPGKLWELIRASTNAISVSTDASLSDDALLFVLRNKATVFLIDDNQQRHPVDFFRTHLLIQLARLCSNSKTWSVLVASREFAEGDDVVAVRPLATQEARNTFLALCAENGWKRELSAYGATLQHAFSSEATRLPLFVALSAYLVVVGRLEAELVLQMQAPELLNRYYATLAARDGGGDQVDRGDAWGSLTALAFGVWPSETAMSIVDARAYTKRSVAEPTPVEALVNMGCLWEGSDGRIAFPHSAFLHYLAGIGMQAAGDFDKLRIADEVLAATVAPFLANVVTVPDQLAPLGRSSLLAYALVCRLLLREQKLSADALRQTSLEVVARRFRENASDDRQAAPWASFVETLNLNRDWVERSCLEARPLTEVAVVFAAALKREDWISRWLDDSANQSVVREALQEDSVRLALKGVLRTHALRTPSGRAAFLQLGTSKRPDAQKDAFGWLRRSAQSFDNDAFAWLSTQVMSSVEGRPKLPAPPTLEAIAHALSTVPLESKYRASAVMATSLKRALIPAGSYPIALAGKPKEDRRLRSAILVPTERVEVLGPFRDDASANAAIARATRTMNVMSESEGIVAMQHFGCVLPSGRGAPMFEALRKEGSPLEFGFWRGTSGDELAGRRGGDFYVALRDVKVLKPTKRSLG